MSRTTQQLIEQYDPMGKEDLQRAEEVFVKDIKRIKEQLENYQRHLDVIRYFLINKGRLYDSAS